MIRERIPISDSFRSKILSDRCGGRVEFTISGTITVLTAPQKPVGPQDLRVANIAGFSARAPTRCRSRLPRSRSHGSNLTVRSSPASQADQLSSPVCS